MTTRTLSFILILALLHPHALAFEDPGALEGSFNSLTDEEQHEANTYKHSGRSERIRQEKCSDYKGYDDLCNNGQSAFRSKGMQTVEMMIPIASKAWSMFSGVSAATGQAAGKLSFNAKDANGDKVFVDKTTGKEINAKSPSGQGKDAKYPGGKSESDMAKDDSVQEKQEEKTDYCQFIPIAGEVGAEIMSVIQAGNTNSQFERAGDGNAQVASMYATKKSQKDRAIVAGVQSGVWGGTGVCYGAMLIAGAKPDFGTVAKLAAAGLLTTFFILKTAAHAKRAKLIQQIINKLPKTGDCNPHTDTMCFCNEPSSFQHDPTNYGKYCLPHALGARGNPDSFACVTADMKPDPACNCKASGSCSNKRLKLASVEIGLDPILMKDAFASLKPLNEGTAEGDILGQARRNKAIIDKLLKKYEPKNVPNFKLNANQKEMARLLTGHGIPAGVAAYMASRPNVATPPSIGTGGYGGENDKIKKLFKRGEQGLTFKRSRISRSKFKKKTRGSLKKGSRRGGDGVENLDSYFAEKATQAAQINNDPGKNIFDIVTYRYKMSAWSRFEDQMKEAPQADKKPASTP